MTVASNTTGSRVVVTGHDGAGRAVIVEDSRVDWHADPAPDYRYALIWGADVAPHFPDDGQRQLLTASSPQPGGMRLVHLEVLPNDVVTTDAPRPGRAGILTRPGDLPGMHFTASIDLVVVIEGEVCCQLDDGAEIHLKQGEFLVQNGTRHKWGNHTSMPAHLGVVAIGVEHDERDRLDAQAATTADR
jgi:hypothetical protein